MRNLAILNSGEVLCSLKEDNKVLDEIINARWTCRSFTDEVPTKEEFCDLFGLPVGRYGFHACILGHRKGEKPEPHPCTSEVHWL